MRHATFEFKHKYETGIPQFKTNPRVNCTAGSAEITRIAQEVDFSVDFQHPLAHRHQEAADNMSADHQRKSQNQEHDE